MNKNTASTKPMEKGTNPNPSHVKTNPRHNIPKADEDGNVSNGDLYGTTCRSSSSSTPASTSALVREHNQNRTAVKVILRNT